MWGRRAASGVLVLLLVGACSPNGAASETTTVDPGSSSTTSTAAAPSSTTSTTVDPTAAVVELFETLVEEPSEVVTAGLSGVVDVEEALPAGATVTPVLDTLRIEGSLAEVVAEVELPDGTVDRFGVVMVRDGDEWLIAYTVQAP